MMALEYFRIGLKDKGNAILDAIAKNSVEYLKWYASLKPSQQMTEGNQIGQNMAVLNQVMQISNQSGGKTIFNKYLKTFETFAMMFNMK
jgi:hypothetical protein